MAWPTGSAPYRDYCVLIVQDMAFECAVHPEDLQLKASLGNVTAVDAALPDNNPYRIACQPRAGGSTSLIEVRLRQSSAWALQWKAVVAYEHCRSKHCDHSTLARVDRS